MGVMTEYMWGGKLEDKAMAEEIKGASEGRKFIRDRVKKIEHPQES